jgi:RNA polymerase sigma-70 factor (ECF subfamily)
VTPMGDDEDRALIREFVDRHDGHAFEKLVQKHLAGMRRLLYGLFNGNREDMEDAEQEVLLSLFRSLPGFRGDSSFKTYLYRLCRNRSIDMLRKRRRDRRIIEFARKNRPPQGEDPEELVLNREKREEILQDLQSLDKEERTLVILKDIEGMSVRELSDIMGIPEGTVKSRLHRTRGKLVEMIGGKDKWIAGM